MKILAVKCLKVAVVFGKWSTIFFYSRGNLESGSFRYLRNSAYKYIRNSPEFLGIPGKFCCKNTAEFRGIPYVFQKIPYSAGSKKSTSVDTLLQTLQPLGQISSTTRLDLVHFPMKFDAFVSTKINYFREEFSVLEEMEKVLFLAIACGKCRISLKCYQFMTKSFKGTVSRDE